jgi:hypothetical protein
VKNEVLHRVKKDRNILHTIKRRKTNWSGHILKKLMKEDRRDGKTRKKT